MGRFFSGLTGLWSYGRPPHFETPGVVAAVRAARYDPVVPDRYAGFISYAHRYEAWVGALQRNLEACLRTAGADRAEVFLDQSDLASGRSWVAQLQEGLGKSDHLILVATPEALASPRVDDEWESFVGIR